MDSDSPTAANRPFRFQIALTFLSLFFGGLASSRGDLPHAIVLLIKDPSSKYPGKSHWIWNLRFAARLVAQATERGHEVFFHLACHDYQSRHRAELRSRPLKKPPYIRDHCDPATGDEVCCTFFRGTIESARVIGSVWLDIDYGDSGHQKTNLPPDRAAALNLVDEIGAEFFSPSMVIDSGHGFHCYWLFREPWVIEQETEKDRALVLVRAVESLAGTVTARIGVERTGSPWALDATHDLARVLRVPGTVNRKSDPPVAVRTERIVEARYNPSDLEDHPSIEALLAEHHALGRRRSSSSRKSAIHTVRRLDPPSPLTEERAREMQQRAEMIAKIDSNFASLWRHELDEEIAAAQQADKRPVDTSFSTYDFRLAQAVLSKGWSPEDTLDLLRAHYVQHGRDPDAKSASYYLRTVENALPDDSDSDEQVERIPPAPEATRPVVTNAAEARQAAREVNEEWEPGTQSLIFCGWPGTGKTTAAGHVAIESLHSRARGYESGVAVLVLPTRDLVSEKAAALAEHARELGLSTSVHPWFGRSKDPDSGSFCQAIDRQQLRAELHLMTCHVCPLRESCEETPGNFQHTRMARIELMRAARKGDAPPVLFIVTSSLLPWLWKDLPQRIPIILDDAGAAFGLTREIPLRHLDVLSAAAHARQFVEDRLAGGEVSIADLVREREEWESREHLRSTARETMRRDLRSSADSARAGKVARAWARRAEVPERRLVSLIRKHWKAEGSSTLLRLVAGLERQSDALHVVLAADLTARVLDAIVLPKSKKKEEKSDRITEAVASLPAVTRRGLQSDLVIPPPAKGRAPSWPWDESHITDGRDLRPAFSRMAIDVAKEAVLGFPPVVSRHGPRSRERGDPEHSVYLPDHELVRRARKGWVTWLGVGPMPRQVQDSLSARQEVVLARPRNLLTVVALVEQRQLKNGDVVYLSFGPAGRQPDRPNLADRITRDFYSALRTRVESGAASLDGRPLRRLGAILHQIDWEELGKPEHVGYYGRDQAGTDQLQDRDVLVVRRCVPPLAEAARIAECLRRALRLEPVRFPDLISSVERYWEGGRESVRTFTLADPLGRDVARFHELHFQLNAVGRCRPLSNTCEGRVVILLAGRPFDWIRPDFRYLTPRLMDELGLKAEIPGPVDTQALLEQHNETRARHIESRRAEIRRIFESDGARSNAELARHFGVAVSTIRRDLQALEARGEGESLRATRAIKVLIPRVSGSDSPVDLPEARLVVSTIRTRRGSAPALSTVTRTLRRIKTELERTSPGFQPCLLPSRSDEARNLRRVVDAVHELMGIDVDAAGPAAGATPRSEDRADLPLSIEDPILMTSEDWDLIQPEPWPETDSTPDHDQTGDE